jgi:hypothetical protein
MRLLSAAALLAVGAILVTSTSRTGANLNLPAPVIGQVASSAPAVTPRRRVLLVVLDGLRADRAKELPFLQELARTGASARLWAEPPTYSTAQYVALLAGVPPAVSGVRTNQTIRPAGVDDVALRVRGERRRTAVLSTGVDWWSRLFPHSWDAGDVVPLDGVLAEAGRFGANDLLVVHLTEVDDAGHAFGARSAAYAQAAQTADRMTAALARAWGWPAATIVVTSDHGHRDGGGHGGAEPVVRETFLLAGGPGLRPRSTSGDARSIDLAPTLAALLGVSAPAQASGRTLTDLLDLPPGARTEIENADRERLARVTSATETALAAATRSQRIGRWWRTLPALALAALGVRLGRRNPWAVLRGLVGLAVTVGAFILIYGPPSLSAARVAIVWTSGLGALAFVCAAAGMIPCLRVRAGALEPAVVVVGFSAPALAAFVHSGLFAHRLVCQPAWVAVGPPIAYAMLASAAGAGLLATLLAAGLRRRREGHSPADACGPDGLVGHDRRTG